MSLASRTPSAREVCKRLATAGVVLACVAAGVQTILYLLDVYALDRSVAMFDVDEGAVSTWASSSATFVVGFVALLLYFVDSTERMRGPALALACAYLSFDDTATVHETIGDKVTAALNLSGSYVQVVWPALYFPLLVAVAVMLLRLADESPVARRLVVAGLALLVVGVAMEVAGIALDKADVDKSSWLWTTEFMLEEGVELAGWILIATGASVRLITALLEPQGPTGEARHASACADSTAERDTADALPM